MIAVPEALRKSTASMKHRFDLPQSSLPIASASMDTILEKDSLCEKPRILMSHDCRRTAGALTAPAVPQASDQAGQIVDADHDEDRRRLGAGDGEDVAVGLTVRQAG